MTNRPNKLECLSLVGFPVLLTNIRLGWKAYQGQLRDLNGTRQKQQWMKQGLNGMRLTKIWVSLKGENLTKTVRDLDGTQQKVCWTKWDYNRAIFLKIWVSLMPGPRCNSSFHDWQIGQIKLECLSLAGFPVLLTNIRLGWKTYQGQSRDLNGTRQKQQWMKQGLNGLRLTKIWVSLLGEKSRLYSTRLKQNTTKGMLNKMRF